MDEERVMSEATKERPILFSGPMVRAILEERKTQTRRIVKGKIALEWLNDAGMVPEFVAEPLNGLSPYGFPGDRLWVRETWMENHSGPEINGHGRPLYRASWGNAPEGQRWKPSIHMPRWASRLTLEVLSVRIERLQDITNDDAMEEGIEVDIWDQAIVARKYDEKDAWFQVWTTDMENYASYETIYRESFRTLWESINGAGSWDLNPWVWRIEFKKKGQEALL